MKTKYMQISGKKILLKLILATCIVTVLVATFFAIPSSDDFTNTLQYLTSEGSWIEYALWNISDIYARWSGMYFATFLSSFPTYYILGMPGLRIHLLLSAIFFFLSVIICIYAGVSKVWMMKDNRKFMGLLIATIVIFYSVNTNNLSEIFYWQTGTCAYTIPLSFAFFAIAAYLKYQKDKKNYYVLILGILFSACGAGGALDISAFLCSVLLFCILYDFLVKKSFGANCLIGIVALLCSIVNVIAPGNYVRHAVIDSEIRLASSIYKTIIRVWDVAVSDFESGILLVIVIITFIASYKRLEDCNFEFKYPGLVTLYCCVGIFLTDFPVTLGYSRADLPDRACFVEHVSIIIFILIAVIYWSGWSAKRDLFNLSREWLLLIALICVISISGNLKSDSFKEFTTSKMIASLIKGDYSEKMEEQESIISQIENSTEKDIIVYIKRPKEDSWTNLKTIGLQDDVSNWVNVGLANYYGKDSILLKYEE